MRASLLDPLDVLRLGLVIDNLTAPSERVSQAGEISGDDVTRLIEAVEHLQDFRPGTD